jgi:hypothetical protein
MLGIGMRARATEAFRREFVFVLILVDVTSRSSLMRLRDFPATTLAECARAAGCSACSCCFDCRRARLLDATLRLFPSVNEILELIVGSYQLPEILKINCFMPSFGCHARRASRVTIPPDREYLIDDELVFVGWLAVAVCGTVPNRRPLETCHVCIAVFVVWTTTERQPPLSDSLHSKGDFPK